MNIKKISWENAVFFFDVDDTLIDTASNSVIASEAISNVLSANITGHKVEDITKEFNKIFFTLMKGHMAKNDKDWQSIEGGKNYHDSLVKRIEKFQQPIIKDYGMIKKWSREVFLKMALEDCDVSLEKEIIYKAIDEYWNTLSKKSLPMPGVLDLIKEITLHNRPIYLITSSDARLQLNENNEFIYNPIYSENFKVKRMEALKVKGIIFNQVSIGDPEDKPNKDFFEKGIVIAEKDLDKKIDHKYITMFGDSYAGDLQTPLEKLGFGLGVLFRKNQSIAIEESENYISTGNLISVLEYLE